MLTNIITDTNESIILQIMEVSKYYKCDDEENNLINFINFIKRKEDLGIKSISMSVSKGKVLGIIGQKKCGKSTLLKIIAGVIKPSSGKILYKGKKITDIELREEVSYISKERPNGQEYTCTVFENIIQYARRDNKDRCEIVDKAEKLIADFGMEEFKYKEVIKIPNNIRFKMLIVRGLLSHKPIMCFDFPLTYIEEEYKENFIKYIKELMTEGKTIIISADEKEAIQFMCDNFIEL